MPTQWRVIANSMGRGRVFKANINFTGTSESKLEFSEGWGFKVWISS